VKQIPEGVKFTFMSDSCHSGGLIDETKEQIGDAEEQYEQEQSSVSEGAAKEMSAEVLALRLSERSGHPVEVGNIRTTLFDIFGDDASLTVKMFENLVLLQINEVNFLHPFHNSRFLMSLLKHIISVLLKETSKNQCPRG